MRKRKELYGCISHLDNLLPVLIKHFQVPDLHKLVGIKITFQQYLALNILIKKGRCMISDLSKSLGVALSTMTELVNRLAKKQFVKKIKDYKDRRIVWINLTEKGVKIIQELNRRKQKHILSVLERLTEKERQLLINILRKISRVAKRIEMGGIRI
ncbi:MAG: MarR family transcriptional regulator [Candidatus Omnitrophica bacterium]|nr:MarR family transcriptional regulator [Candidatus Omnitrophota bacterium]